jgi:hypothetical protein
MARCGDRGHLNRQRLRGLLQQDDSVEIDEARALALVVLGPAIDEAIERDPARQAEYLAHTPDAAGTLPRLTPADLAHLKRWADDDRAQEVWDTINRAAMC